MIVGAAPTSHDYYVLGLSFCATECVLGIRANDPF